MPVYNEDGLFTGYVEADRATQKKRDKAWDKAQKAIDKLRKNESKKGSKSR